ncbi:MAG TPA: FHA domain-containing protein, partial [Gammaproteobacteria bacterium]|nr:FHA domain-containing protein [Gammaproteobacteria bacterium]
MRCLLRRLTRTKAGSAFRDTVVEADTLTIGRATNQQIFLPDLRVALEHAVLHALPDGRFSIKSKTVAGLHVNGHLVQAQIVKP